MTAPTRTTTPTLAPGELAALMPSWARSLRAENKSPRTVTAYLSGGQQLLSFLQASGMPTHADAIRREHVEAFIEHVLENNRSSTAATRYRDLQQLFKWLTEEGEIQESPMARMHPPRLEERPVPIVSDDHLRALFRVCQGKTFDDRRDTALLRAFLNTGARLAEMANLRLEDVELDARELYVTGKGKKGRYLALGPKAVKDLDRYLRLRARHKEAAMPWLWLGPRGHLTDSGIAQMLRRRCRQAGIPAIHPHQFRHTYSHKWLAAGGAEHDLAKLNGWTTLAMVGRYASSAAGSRARAAHARIDPGGDL